MITKMTLSDQVYEHIKLNIIKNNFKPGEKLAEVSLATALGVSPTPVREAFKRLQTEGFIEIIPYKGVHVKTYTKDEIVAAYQIRANLEALALRMLLLKNDAEVKANMIAQLEKAVNSASDHIYLRLLPFHDYLIRETKNSVIINVLTSLNAIINIDRVLENLYGLDEQSTIDAYKGLKDLITNDHIKEAEIRLEYLINDSLKFIKFNL